MMTRRHLWIIAAAGMVLAGCTRSTDRTVQPDPVAVAESLEVVAAGGLPEVRSVQEWHAGAAGVRSTDRT